MSEHLSELKEEIKRQSLIAVGSNEQAAVIAAVQLHDFLIPQLTWTEDLQAAKAISDHAKSTKARGIADEDVMIAVLMAGGINNEFDEHLSFNVSPGMTLEEVRAGLSKKQKQEKKILKG